MIGNLVSRAAARALSLASISIRMCLEKQLTYSRVIRPAIPSSERKFLLKLLQLEIAAHPPPAAICSLTLTAEAGQNSKVQLGLFAPQTPEPSRLDVTLARLKALVGDDHVGSAVLSDTHRSGSFTMENFSMSSQPSLRIGRNSSNIAAAHSTTSSDSRSDSYVKSLLHFGMEQSSYDVQVAYGPWHSSGCWWSSQQMGYGRVGCNCHKQSWRDHGLPHCS